MKHLPQRIEVTGRQVRPGDLVHLNGIGWKPVSAVAFGNNGAIALSVDGKFQSLRPDDTLFILRDQPHNASPLES